ncbi:MAG: hypothetical protein RJA44_131 [Pseudomonadota bacterium]
MTTASDPTPAEAGPLVRCPGCAGPARFHPSNPWRPFCSARCKGVDLGAWASEDYRVAATPPTDPDDELR